MNGRNFIINDSGEYVITGREFVGTLGDGTNNFDLFVRAYDGNNQLLWSDTFDGSDNVQANLDEGWGVAIDDDGHQNRGGVPCVASRIGDRLLGDAEHRGTDRRRQLAGT